MEINKNCLCGFTACVRVGWRLGRNEITPIDEHIQIYLFLKYHRPNISLPRQIERGLYFYWILKYCLVLDLIIIAVGTMF
jgi:hypothetical protein